MGRWFWQKETKKAQSQQILFSAGRASSHLIFGGLLWCWVSCFHSLKSIVYLLCRAVPCRGPGGWPAGAISTGLSLLAFLLDQTVGKRSLEGSVLIQPLLNLSPLTQVTCPICYLSVPWLLQYFGIFKSQTFNLAPVYFRSFHAVIWNDVMQRFLCFLFPFLKVMFLLPLFLKKLLLFNYSCMPFLPISCYHFHFHLCSSFFER